LARKKGASPIHADPHREREAQKYDNPIPSREFILQRLEANGAPMAYKAIAKDLQLEEPGQLDGLDRRLRAMERDGQLVCNRRGAYCLVNKKDLIAGRVIGHPDGFGFLKPDAGGEDLFLSPKQMRQLFHDDRAVARVVGIDRRGRKEGAIVEVLERAHHRIVGRLWREQGVGFVQPDNKRLAQDIVVPESEFGGAEDGQIVTVEITEQPTKRSRAVGRVVEVLGEHMAPGMETELAIRSHELPVDWPEEVEQQIADLNPEVPEEAKKGRADLRTLPLVTIDGEDARDFDDAVYCERKPSGWKLVVCIADVSSYVTPDTPLDREARHRGTSVYFPDRVVPMLPEILSNGLCSLNPQVDRLCMACEMYIGKDGRITRSRFFEAVMRSQARLTYSKVAAILDGDGELSEQYADLLPHIFELHSLFETLHSARAVRGAIDFDTTETRIRFDDNGKVDEIVPLVRNVAHRIIEECMLVANVAAARFLERKKVAALYRIHETPSAEKLEDLRSFLGELGLGLGGGDKPEALHYAKLLDSVKHRPDAHLIQTVLLRSMMQAVYSRSNQGHFGLAFPAYAHFTSPIRRYPDLIVHRAIKHALSAGGNKGWIYSDSDMEQLGEHCSSAERRADEATRDATDWLKCEYMMDKVGESFDGIITSVNSFGLFVELNDIYVDGLLHITALDNDYYHFDPVGHRLTGERAGKVHRLGDPMHVTLARVDLDQRRIDFVLPQEEQAPRKRGRRSRSKRRKG
jgi:ribonuclease R